MNESSATVGWPHLAALPPAFPEAFEALYQALWSQSHMQATTLELCRRRLSQLHGVSADWAPVQVQLTAQQLEALSNWHNSEHISEAQAACIGFAEVYAMDAQAITDDHAAAVKAHYGEPGLVLLIEALGIFDGMARLAWLWQWNNGEVQ